MATKKRVFKSKKKLSGGQTSFRKWSEWKEGDFIVGKFISAGEDNYQNPSFTFEVLTADFKGKTKTAAALVGKNITLNSAGQLNKAMLTKDGELKVKPGELLEITYNGTSTIPKGKFKGKEAHLMTVEVVEEEGAESEVDEEVDEDEDEETDEDDDSDDDDDEEEEDEDDL